MTKELTKIYINIEHSYFQNTIVLFASNMIDIDGLQQDVLYTRKSILSMPVCDKAELSYQILAREYDVYFIFDDNIPKPQFYPVPQLFIFATDSLGGFFVSTNTVMSISEEDAPIYYIDKNLKVYYLSSNPLRDKRPHHH